MGAELQKFTGLANMFDFPEVVQPAAEGCAEIRADLVMVKDVWDVSAMVEQQFVVSQGSELQALLCPLGTTRDAVAVHKPAHRHSYCILCQPHVLVAPDLGRLQPLQHPCGKISACRPTLAFAWLATTCACEMITSNKPSAVTGVGGDSKYVSM